LIGTSRAVDLAMNPKQEALKARMKRFALDVLDVVETFRGKDLRYGLGGQLVDAATSVGANYRAACRARSDAEFAAKIGQALEESDESLLWLELCDARAFGLGALRTRLLGEANELTALFAASSITARQTAAARRPPRDLKSKI
jgi:four helix bundle protein